MKMFPEGDADARNDDHGAGDAHDGDTCFECQLARVGNTAVNIARALEARKSIMTHAAELRSVANRDAGFDTGISAAILDIFAHGLMNLCVQVAEQVDSRPHWPDDENEEDA